MQFEAEAALALISMASNQAGLEDNLKTHFHLTPEEAEELVLELQKRGFISLLENGRVEYKLTKAELAAA